MYLFRKIRTKKYQNQMLLSVPKFGDGSAEKASLLAKWLGIFLILISFCLTCFSEDYSWISVAFLTSNVWLTICLHYRWNNRSILKFQISKFQKLKFQNFKNWNFKILKLEISNFEFLKIKIVREAILSTCFSEIDLNDINLAILYCHWYLVFFTWFINWKSK